MADDAAKYFMVEESCGGSIRGTAFYESMIMLQVPAIRLFLVLCSQALYDASWEADVLELSKVLAGGLACEKVVEDMHAHIRDSQRGSRSKRISPEKKSGLHRFADA